MAGLILVVKVLVKLLIIFFHSKITGCKLVKIPKMSPHKVLTAFAMLITCVYRTLNFLERLLQREKNVAVNVLQ